MKEKIKLYNIYVNGVLVNKLVPFSRVKKNLELLKLSSLFGEEERKSISLQIETVNDGKIWEH